jgi:acetyltransferase
MTLPIQLTRPAHGFRDTALFHPRSVVLVADASMPEASILARNLAGGGFQGQLYSIGLETAGLMVSPSIAALPETPDLAILCLPPTGQPAAMAELAAKGCFAAVVPVASPDLAALCASSGVRAFGGHSFGLCLPAIGLNASLSHMAPKPGRLALLCQSAAIARAVIDWADGEDLGFSHIVGIGTNQGVGFAMALDWLARDPLAGAVLLDIRRIKNRRMFISAARATARTRPVVALRAGGRQGDASGTSDAVMEAALRRAGVLRVAGFEDLMTAAETLARVRPARRVGADAVAGDRIAIVSNGQGPAQLAADAVLAGGGRLAHWDDAASTALALALPNAAAANPLLLSPMQSHRLAEAAVLLAAMPQVDSVVAIHAPSADLDGDVAVQAMAAAARATRGAPILVSWLGQSSAGPARRRLAGAGIAVFASPEAAVRGALHLATDRRNRAAAAELPPRDVLRLTPDRAAVRSIIDTAREESRLTLTEQEALAILAAYCQAVVPGEIAADAAAAEHAASRLGFPVVLKVSSPDLPRKTEIGGVVLGLDSPMAVRQAAEAMLARIRREYPAVRLHGLLVQRQVGLGTPKAHELRLHLGDDPMFGPWISYGRGGTASDFEPDVAFDLPPLNRTLAMALIRRTRGVRLLSGFRDLAAVDLEQVSDAVVRLSQIAVDFPEIEDLIVNPLLARGEDVVVLDASLRLRPGQEKSFLAIPPYPAELSHRWLAKDGRHLLIRPIRPEDAEAHAEAFRHLTPEDVRWRFFSQIRALPPEQIARMTQIDYDREMAFIAVEQQDGQADRTVATARLIREPGSDSGEFAIVTLPGWKGQGLGRHMMQQLLDWARAQGMRSVAGQVLVDNRPMIGFVTALGFVLHRSPEDDEVMDARIDF